MVQTSYDYRIIEIEFYFAYSLPSITIFNFLQTKNLKNKKVTDRRIVYLNFLLV